MRIVEFEVIYDAAQMWNNFELVNFLLIGIVGVRVPPCGAHRPRGPELAA